MLLFLKKLLPLLFSPLMLVLLLLALAWLLRKRWPVFVAAGLLYLASNNLVADRLLHMLESRYAPVPIASAGPADAVVVLGGIFGVPEADGIMPNFGQASERIEGGIRLVQHKRAPLLVLAGARLPWRPDDISEGERGRREAIEHGIAPEKILITSEVADTVDEATAVAAMVRERGWKRVILVTSALHMPRAARMFRWRGVPFTPFPVDYLYDPHRSMTPLDLLPNANALGDTSSVLRECYGIAFYMLLGR
jgi:uncharacterized SAM-binding protein YcdF (DUF218 family)